MERRTRKPNRLKNYDYSQNGAYFVTICTQKRAEILWDNSGGNVGAVIGRPEITKLNQNGLIIQNAIEQISLHYKGVNVDNYVIMPNHVHMIIMVCRDCEIRENGRPMTAPTISNIVNQFKGYCSKKIGFPIWQRSFHDHIIRSEEEYLQIWKYIDENPIKWKLDDYYKLNID